MQCTECFAINTKMCMCSMRVTNLQPVDNDGISPIEWTIVFGNTQRELCLFIA